MDPFDDPEIVSSDQTTQSGEDGLPSQNVYSYVVRLKYKNTSDVAFDQELFSQAIEYMEKDLSGMFTFDTILKAEKNDHVELEVVNLEQQDNIIYATFRYNVYKIE